MTVMNPEYLKSQILHQNIQSVVMDGRGEVLLSDDCLTEIPLGISIMEEDGVFVGMMEVIDELEEGEEFKLDCIETDFFDRQSIYDFMIKRLPDEFSEKRYLLLIYDLEDVYRKVVDLRQERNEAQMYVDQLTMAHEELKQTQLQLVSSEKLASVGLLAAGMSHEINNPLNYIFNGAALIKRSLNGSLEKSPQVEEMLTIIETGANRIREVVAQLKLFDASSQNEEKVIDIHENIDHAVDLVKHQFEGNAEIKRHYLNEEVSLKCSPGKIKQVLFNLLMNAVNFTRDRKDPQIRVETKKEEKKLIVQISDNGVGIPKALKAKVFDPFFSTKKLSTGRGLGLSVSKMIIKEHGGDLWLESQEGVGTTCYISLPLRTS